MLRMTRRGKEDPTKRTLRLAKRTRTTSTTTKCSSCSNKHSSLRRRLTTMHEASTNLRGKSAGKPMVQLSDNTLASCCSCPTSARSCATSTCRTNRTPQHLHLRRPKSAGPAISQVLVSKAAGAVFMQTGGTTAAAACWRWHRRRRRWEPLSLALLLVCRWCRKQRSSGRPASAGIAAGAVTE